MTVPILFLTDSPDLSSGLARIGRDLATRVHQHMADTFHVGFLGRGGIGSSHFPFPTYVIPHSLIGSGSCDEWGASVLPQVWKDFTGAADAPGIVFTIWDPARLLWLSRPEYLTVDNPAKQFLTHRPFKLWGYFPVDGHNTHGTLGRLGRESLAGCDRILAYTPYGAKVIHDTLTNSVYDCGIIPDLPHGLDPVWHPRDRSESRAELGWADNDFLVGVVATNQSRKDWGLAAEVGAILHARLGDRYRQWWHVDREEGAWSIPALLDEYNLGPATLVSSQQDDEWMAKAYSACNVTLAIGAGEGFGLNIIESQACGTPVIHGDYAGGAGLVCYGARMPWKHYRLDGPLAIIRPVFEAKYWANHCAMVGTPIAPMDQFRWENLWPRWAKWFGEGLA